MYSKMDKNNKFEAFKYITRRIDNRSSMIEAALNQTKNTNISEEKIIFSSDSNETSCNVIKFDENSTTKTIINDRPKRITCLSGEINVMIPHYGEKFKLKPQDTQLIPSNTYHIIEATKPSEIIVIYKNRLYEKDNVEKITEKETIYSKL